MKKHRKEFFPYANFVNLRKMQKIKTPHDLLISIVKEKHTQIPNIMEETGIDCWLVFVRETAGNPDPVMKLATGGDVVWESAYIFMNNKEGFSKTAIVGEYDAPPEENKGIWDNIIPW